jgi:hypothetical protein
MNIPQEFLERIIDSRVSPPALRTLLAIMRFHPSDEALTSFAPDEAAAVAAVSEKTLGRHATELTAARLIEDISDDPQRTVWCPVYG